jgi:hypothetical protein
MSTDLNRRTLLEQAGTGTVALRASVWAGMGSLPAAADDGHEGIGFFFAALDAHNPTSPNALLMQGCGHFDQHSGDIGGSSFSVHYDGSSPLSPKPIKATGFGRHAGSRASTRDQALVFS